jgi:hypothetical protein
VRWRVVGGGRGRGAKGAEEGNAHSGLRGGVVGGRARDGHGSGEHVGEAAAAAAGGGWVVLLLRRVGGLLMMLHRRRERGRGRRSHEVGLHSPQHCVVRSTHARRRRRLHPAARLDHQFLLLAAEDAHPDDLKKKKEGLIPFMCYFFKKRWNFSRIYISYKVGSGVSTIGLLGRWQHLQYYTGLQEKTLYRTKKVMNSKCIRSALLDRKTNPVPLSQIISWKELLPTHSTLKNPISAGLVSNF